MPHLSRHGRLLRTVNGKPHATQDDHVEQLPTPTSTISARSYTHASNVVMDEDDITRSPESSEDDTPVFSHPMIQAKFKTPKEIDHGPENVVKKATFRQPRYSNVTKASDNCKALEHDRGENQAAALSKDIVQFRPPREIDGSHHGSLLKSFSKPRSSLSPQDSRSAQAKFSDPSSSEDQHDWWVTDNVRRKRQKSSGVVNFHAQPQRKPKMYGKSKTYSSRNSSNDPTAKTTPTLDSKPQNTPARPQFKIAKGADMFQFGDDAPKVEFRAARGAADGTTADAEWSCRLSSPCSSLSSLMTKPEENEIEKLDLPAPRPTQSECAICGEQVDVLLREDFEYRFTKGVPILNYKWQQRFCRWHRAHEAKRIQMERGYPEVDWSGLEERMQRHHRHLKNVVSRVTPSHYRDELSEKIKERSKTAMQALNSDGAKRGASVGYYGPRGERVMTEHIIHHLSDKLRQESSRDRLVAAAGVSGGVSGFVQAVLVPELAEQLIMEDMNVSSATSRTIITESAELGELLHPDVDDKVAGVAEL